MLDFETPWSSLIQCDPKLKYTTLKLIAKIPLPLVVTGILKTQKKSFKTLMWNVKLSCKELKGWKTG